MENQARKSHSQVFRVCHQCCEWCEISNPVSWVFFFLMIFFKNVCCCIGRESNPGLPRGRREFYH